jgi:FKBP-type peptidyl-prolyl cis-trans isomerase
MFYRIIHKLSGFILLLLLISCDQGSNTSGKVIKNMKKEETGIEERGKALEKANKYLVRTEQEEINNYIRRHSLKMQETGSGLRYMIYENGSGPKAEEGKTAVLNYTLKLLTGDIIYSSKEDGQKVFKIGKGSVESGLEEAILKMRVGDKAIVILPAHLGYGLLGDNNKIPPRCTLVYDLELVDLK